MTNTPANPLNRLAPPGMWYILDDNNNPVECRDYETVFKWTEGGRKYKGIRETRQHSGADRYRVSTVFLMLDHIGGMFETMVFDELNRDSPGTEIPLRTKTYKEAVKLHKEVCRIIKHRKLNKVF